MSYSLPIRVIKLGGSLLQRPTLRQDMLDWLQKQSQALHVCIVGGGKIVDAMRELDGVHGLDKQAMHWRCVEMLTSTFEIACELFPDWIAVRSKGQFDQILGLKQTPSCKPFLVNVPGFYSSARRLELPCDWRTTTDAIAAALSIDLSADELVLLKSCDVPDVDLTDLSNQGVVDQAIVGLADGIPRVRIVRLPIV